MHHINITVVVGIILSMVKRKKFWVFYKSSRTISRTKLFLRKLMNTAPGLLLQLTRESSNLCQQCQWHPDASTSLALCLKNHEICLNRKKETKLRNMNITACNGVKFCLTFFFIFQKYHVIPNARLFCSIKSNHIYF